MVVRVPELTFLALGVPPALPRAGGTDTSGGASAGEHRLPTTTLRHLLTTLGKYRPSTCRSAGADLQVMLAAASTRDERTPSVDEVLDLRFTR